MIHIHQTVRRASLVAVISTLLVFTLWVMTRMGDNSARRAGIETKQDWLYDLSMGARFFLIALGLIVGGVSALVAIGLHLKAKRIQRHHRSPTNVVPFRAPARSARHHCRVRTHATAERK